MLRTGSTADRRSTTGSLHQYRVKLITRRIKKQQQLLEVVQKLNLEPQQTEFMKDWVKETTQCSHATIGQINMYSDNQASIRIVSEPFHHDNTNNMKRGPHVYKHSSRNCRCANRKTEVKSPRRTKWNHKYLYQLKGEYRIQDFSPELWTLIS